MARAAGVVTNFGLALARNDILCPNETESLTGLPVPSLEQAAEAGRTLPARGVRNISFTLGERSSLLVTSHQTTHLPMSQVPTLDIPGAGDVFVGCLAHFLPAGEPMLSAIERANRIAAISVQASGAPSSFPNASELLAELLAHGR